MIIKKLILSKNFKNYVEIFKHIANYKPVLYPNHNRSQINAPDINLIVYYNIITLYLMNLNNLLHKI